MTPASIPVVDLLPHGSEMALIDQLLESSESRSVAAVEIRADSEFAGPAGVPCWVGLEYMAQTIAARVGFEAYLNGEEPPLGYLLGTREFVSRVPLFAIGSRLRIIASPLLVDRGFGSFSCSIEIDTVVATAVLNTYRPERPDADAGRGEEEET